MAEEHVVYCEKPSTIEFRDGMVHITDRCGRIIVHRIMRPCVFRRTILRASEALAKWQVEEIAKEGEVVPMAKPRRH